MIKGDTGHLRVIEPEGPKWRRYFRPVALFPSSSKPLPRDVSVFGLPGGVKMVASQPHFRQRVVQNGDLLR